MQKKLFSPQIRRSQAAVGNLCQISTNINSAEGKIFQLYKIKKRQEEGKKGDECKKSVEIFIPSTFSLMNNALGILKKWRKKDGKRQSEKEREGEKKALSNKLLNYWCCVQKQSYTERRYEKGVWGENLWNVAQNKKTKCRTSSIFIPTIMGEKVKIMRKRAWVRNSHDSEGHL